MRFSASFSRTDVNQIDPSAICDKSTRPPIELTGGSFKVSSGLWISPTDTLTTAANQMLAVQTEFLPRHNLPSILEFDASWGALPKYISASEKAAVDYTSANSTEWQKQWLGLQVGRNCNHIDFNVEKATAGDINAAGKYDCIYFLGSFKSAYNSPSCLERLASLLKPDGKLIIEGTFFNNEFFASTKNSDVELKYFSDFPFKLSPISTLPNLLKNCAAIDLQVSEILEHTDSARKTVHAWMTNLMRTMNSNVFEHESTLKLLTGIQADWGYRLSNYVIVLKRKPNKKMYRTLSQSGELV